MAEPGRKALIALDTNLLIYAHREDTVEHRRCRDLIEFARRARGGWGFATATVAEFYSVVTRTPKTGRASSPEEAGAFIEQLARAGARIFRPGPKFAERLLALAGARDVHGAAIFDLQIALAARDSGAREIWTHDVGFCGIEGLPVFLPLRAPTA